jgi:hypothetical protein
MTLAVNLAQGASNNVTFRNKIINGAMVIDQRNAGASVSNSGFIVDRFAFDRGVSTATVTGQQSSTVPTNGFSNSVVLTVGTGAATTSGDYSIFRQPIEGYNVADLNWGTSSAQTITLSFWIRSSLTGTFGVAINNSAQNRYYIGSYTINSANTFEYKTITIPGDQSGTWLKTNGQGINLYWDIGVGSTYSAAAGSWGTGTSIYGLTGGVKLLANTGATWYVTGVQLEAGTTASPFEYRQYGTELQLCQRYYEKTYDQSVVPGTINESGPQFESNGATVTSGGGPIRFTVAKRGTPTVTSYSTATGTSGKVHLRSQGVDVTPSIDLIGQTGTRLSYSQSSGIVNTSYHWVASAEL